MKKRYFTRIDAFANADELEKFLGFAKKRNPKTREDMVAALEAYKKADIIVEEHKERVEAHIVRMAKQGMLKQIHNPWDEHHCPECGPRP